MGLSQIGYGEGEKGGSTPTQMTVNIVVDSDIVDVVDIVVDVVVDVAVAVDAPFCR